MEPHITEITRVIQLAVAPVFLLTAIATLIGALNTRLGRIVDRRRVIQDRLRHPSSSITSEQVAYFNDELELLFRRVRLVYASVFSAVLAALLICCVVASAFIFALVAVEWAKLIAVFFVLAMLALIVCLSLFLREIFLAVSTNYMAR